MKRLTRLSWGYIGVVIALFLYSYTQVDLDLTFSRFGILHTIIKNFQYVGYFNRFLSTLFYICILIFLFIFYLAFLRKVKKGTFSQKEFWVGVSIISGILLFSYNAFSYDLFNYIFDAKIFTFYHQNPYIHKALDYPHDPMVNFMRWTHRTYPYGPVWLLITLPLSYLGMQLFIPTFLLFKTLMLSSYLGSIYFLGKIYKRVFKKDPLFVSVFFAYNPLVIIESLVSAHQDIVMMFFCLVSISLFIEKKYVRSIILLIISGLIKYSTLFLIPLYIAVYFSYIYKKKYSIRVVIVFACVLTLIPIIFASLRTTFEPWYLLWVIPWTSLGIQFDELTIPTVILSFFSLLIYVPYLYTGDWNPPIPSIILWTITLGCIFAILSVAVRKLKMKMIQYAHALYTRLP